MCYIFYHNLKKKKRNNNQLALSPVYIISPVYAESALCAMLGGRDTDRTKIWPLLSGFTMVTHRTTCNRLPATEQALDTSVS